MESETQQSKSLVSAPVTKSTVTQPSPQMTARVQAAPAPLQVSVPVQGSIVSTLRQQSQPLDVTSGVPGGGLLTTTPTSMLSNSLSSAMSIASGHMISHDQDDAVFSPSSVDDERMKQFEKVGQEWCILLK